MRTIKVAEREGFWWSVLFLVVFFTVSPVQLLFYWAGRGFLILSDILRELSYQVFFKQVK